MKLSKSAFTLIEMLISVSILSIMIIFLYKSYADLNNSNIIFMKEKERIKKYQAIKKVLFLDFTKKLSDIKILNQDTDIDIVFFKTSNSLHKRYDPYIGYVVNNGILYRLESLKEITRYPLPNDIDFTVDKIGKVKLFRVYKKSKKSKDNTTITDVSYIIDMKLDAYEKILYKISPLDL